MTETNELILTHLYLAEKIAKNHKRRLGFISMAELKSASYFGLTTAATQYNPKKNDSFVKYAYAKICWAIQDYLRELAWGFDLECLEDEHEYQDTFPIQRASFFESLTKDFSKTNKLVLTLFYVEEQSVKEICDTAGLKPARVYEILQNCRNEIKRKNKEEDLWSEVA